MCEYERVPEYAYCMLVGMWGVRVSAVMFVYAYIYTVIRNGIKKKISS